MGLIRHAPDEVWVAGDEHGPLGVKPKPYPAGPRAFGTWETMYVRADLHQGGVSDRDALAGALEGAAAALDLAGRTTSAQAARAALARHGGQ